MFLFSRVPSDLFSSGFFSIQLICSHLFSSHHLIGFHFVSSHLISSDFSFFASVSSAHLVSALLTSSQIISLVSAHLGSSQLFSPHLGSFQFFWVYLSSSQFVSVLLIFLNFSQFFSIHVSSSQLISALLKPSFRAFFQNLQIEVIKTKFSRKTSFKTCKLQIWNRRFHARLSSHTPRSNCENEAFVQISYNFTNRENNVFVRNSLQNLQAGVVKRTFLRKTSSKAASWSSENLVFVQDILQNLQFQVVKTSFLCETKCLCETTFKTCKFWGSENEVFVRTSCKTCNCK